MEDEILTGMAGAIAHRGPDHRGFYRSDTVQMAMNRLAIIDVAGGNQPLHSSDGKVHLVYNGEIYDFLALREQLAGKHRFETRSDTEVILNGYLEWGEGVFSRLKGIFAVAIWDERLRVLYLARDPFGIKPLYFQSDMSGLTFSSELKSFTRTGLNNRADLAAVTQFLHSTYVFHPDSALDGVLQVRPGTFMKVTESGTFTESRFYRLGETRSVLTADLADHPARHVRQELAEAVVGQTISERPYGLLLSAGMDSMAVLSMLHQADMAENLSTYTVAFDVEEFNEDAYVKRLASEWGLNSHFLRISEEHVVGILPDLFATFDNLEFLPTCVSIYLASHLAADSSRVLLAGNGGDEIFSGYPTHVATRLMQTPVGRAMSVLAPLAHHIGISSAYLGLAEKLKRFLIGARYELPLCHMLWRHAFLNREVAELAPSLHRDVVEVYARQRQVYDEFEHLNLEDFDVYSLLDIQTWMMDCNLMMWDKAGMSASVEIRVPFLDRSFFESMMAIPCRRRMYPLGKKRLLRQAMTGRIPDYILSMPKHGFQAPIVSWMNGAVGGVMRDLSMSLPETIFEHSSIERLWQQLESGKGEYALKLWLLGCLGGWADAHAIRW